MRVNLRLSRRTLSRRLLPNRTHADRILSKRIPLEANPPDTHTLDTNSREPEPPPRVLLVAQARTLPSPCHLTALTVPYEGSLCSWAISVHSLLIGPPPGCELENPLKKQWKPMKKQWKPMEINENHRFSLIFIGFHCFFIGFSMVFIGFHMFLKNPRLDFKYLAAGGKIFKIFKILNPAQHF